MRGTYVFRKGEFVLKGGPKDIRTPFPRSSLPHPMIISDSLGDVWNPVDGKRYDSKSSYYGAVRAAGCEIAGNDSVTMRDRDDRPSADIERDVAKAFDQVA